MFDFRTIGGADFGYLVDFSEYDYANVSFFDKHRKNIPFHLSLRRKTGLAVINTRLDGTWADEIYKEVTLARRGDKVTINFEKNDFVCVRLNGNDLFSFEGDFAGLSEIQLVEFNGGLVQDSLEVQGPANKNRESLGSLELAGYLDIQGWSIDPGLPRQNPEITIEGLTEAILVERRPMLNLAAAHGLSDPQVGIYAVLPGRIWEAAPDGENLTISLSNNGFACGKPLILTRKEVLQRIERMCRQDSAENNTFEQLLAIEHVHFGEFWEALSPHAQAVLQKAATTFGVSDFLNTSDTGAVRVQPEEPESRLLGKIRGLYAEYLSQTQNPDRIAILGKLLDDYPLAPARLHELVLTLTEEFCQAGSFHELYGLAHSYGLRGFGPAEDNWRNTSTLPYLCREGRLEDAQALMWQIANTHGEGGRKSGWLVTSALNWSIRFFITECNTPSKFDYLKQFIYAFFALVDKCSLAYFDFTPSTELIDATTTLLSNSDRLPEDFGGEIETFALRVFGLSNHFWERVADEISNGNIEPSPRLETGASCFDLMRQRMSDKTVDVEPALAFFQAFKTVDVERFRLELLGPLGLQRPKDKDILDALLISGRDPSESVMRYLGFPGVQAPRSGALDMVARDAVRARYLKSKKAPYYNLQFDISRYIIDFTASLDTKDSGNRVESLRAILDRIQLLSSKQSEFLGIGMAINLFQLLIKIDREDLALHVMAWIGAIRAELPKEQQVGLFEAPAIHCALMSLHVTAEGLGSELGHSVSRLFPRFDPKAIDLPVGGPMAKQRNAGSALFDTLVVVFSCKQNLNSRVASMRDGWLSKLQELGVPFLVVVGDGEGQLVDDVLHVDASDSYEGLPQKTLASVKWVYENTSFSHMFKIDDDCFLDPEEFFLSQSYRKFDYYGRRLERVLGQMDRTWHFSKSTSERGRKELDKSPEPSEYADGGSGYALSRKAMQCITRNSQTEAGQRLVSASFMEDKTVGDLLAMSNIRVADEDYYVSIRRRSYKDATPVAMWENSFNAGSSTPVKQVHLDNQADQKSAFQGLKSSGLFPKKIWPTYGKARLGDATNILELISDQSKLEKLNAEPLAVVACVRNEMFMLPHFLAHYRKLGVKAFLVADNCSDDGTLDYLLDQPDVAVFSVDTLYKDSQYGVAWQINILANLRVGRWSLLADADELLVYPGWEKTKLPKLLAGRDYKDTDAVRILMLDMYPQRRLSDVEFKSGDPFSEAGFVDKTPFIDNPSGRGPFSDGHTVSSALRHRLLPSSRRDLFVAQKIALLKYKPWMRLSAGLHYVADVKQAQAEMIFGHFKYNAHFRQKALAEVARGQHFNNAEEYRRYLALTAEGREVIYDPAVSVPWRECETVKRLLKC
ncbi:Galactosyltransferase [Roseovarius litorisediminis]|uniref:Galactosyltransferase n=1 Tax=Roseovarius litorisediminis TaxID=1312363 RepID=A0A1Y5SVQ4_9RHOB|nr:glycosyltransferase family 2 protein [Roseovarius litorisediminis]SLN46274.1 Galactosyltransferase [Roseovarius litorisediminis]